MKYLFRMTILLFATLALLSANAVQAAQTDMQKQLTNAPVPLASSRPMPTLRFGEFGTNKDNLTNIGPAVGGDGDMGGAFPPCVFFSSANHPIEYNINIPKSKRNLSLFNPLAAGGNFRTDVFDVDTNTVKGNPEIDSVTINGVKLGILSGRNGLWGVNNFTIPTGTLKWGRNKVEILVDRGNVGKRANWCTAIGWGIIRVPTKGIVGKGCTVDIVKGWISPREVVRGQITNFFAEVAGNPPFVDVYYHTFRGNGVIRGKPFVRLWDFDKDGIYTAQKVIPRTFRRGWQGWFHWVTVNRNPTTKRRCISMFPALRIK